MHGLTRFNKAETWQCGGEVRQARRKCVKTLLMQKYTVIVKASDDRFLKYRHVTNLERFTAFLDLKFPAWRWYNVYDQNGEQVSNRTNGKAK